MEGPTCVRVEVKGCIDVPLHLGLLADLADPLIEQEVIREAVRIAVSERLGYFDDIDVRLSSSGGRDGGPSSTSTRHTDPEGVPPADETGRKATTNGANTSRGTGTPAALSTPANGRRYCEATVNLVQLGQCIEAIQKAYERLLAHAQLLHDVLSGTTPTSCENEGVEALGAASGNATLTSTTSPVAQSPSSATEAHAASVPSSAPQSVGVADALERLAAARQLAVEMIAEHHPDVIAEAAAAAGRHSDAASPNGATVRDGNPGLGAVREACMMEEEQAMMDVALATRRAERQGRRQWSSCGEEGVDDAEEQDVDAELRYALLPSDADNNVHGHGGRGGATGEDASESPQPDEEEDDDEEQLRERYMRLGYAPL